MDILVSKKLRGGSQSLISGLQTSQQDGPAQQQHKGLLAGGSSKRLRQELMLGLDSYRQEDRSGGRNSLKQPGETGAVGYRVQGYKRDQQESVHTYYVLHIQYIHFFT